MNLPLIIGKSSDDEPFIVDFEQLPHLFVSYCEEVQIHQFFSSLLSKFGGYGKDQLVDFALAFSSGSTAKHIPLNKNHFKYCFVPGDEFSSNTASKEKFLLALSKEMRERSAYIKKVAEGKAAGKKPLVPMVVFLHDVFNIILSKKKSLGLIFLQLLLIGKRLKMHVVASSSNTCRMLFKQLMNINPQVKEKLKKNIGEEFFPVVTPLGAELVFTAEDFIFFKQANAHDYHRLYPLQEKKTIPKTAQETLNKEPRQEDLFEYILHA